MKPLKVLKNGVIVVIFPDSGERYLSTNLFSVENNIALSLFNTFSKIKAPFEGTIDRIPKKLGSLIDEGELLTSLSDNSKVFAYYNVSEPEYLEYETNIKGRGNVVVNLKLANKYVICCHSFIRYKQYL